MDKHLYWLKMAFAEKDGQSWTDQSGHGHLFTNTGTLWTPQGRLADGVDDRIALPASLATYLNKSVTVVARVKRTTTASAGVKGIFTFDDSVDTALGRFRLQVFTNNVLRADYSGSDNAIKAISYTLPSPDTHWHVYAITIDLSALLMRLFMDGKQVGSQTLAVVYAGTSCVGRIMDAYSQWLDGVISHIYGINGALSEPQIAEITRSIKP